MLITYEHQGRWQKNFYDSVSVYLKVSNDTSIVAISWCIIYSAYC